MKASKSTHELILEHWIASLRSKDRSRTAVASNFDELFEELKKDGTSFDDAYAILSKAIKAHLPSTIVTRRTFKKLKDNPEFISTEKEFIEEWCKSISDTATESFYTFFNIKKAEDEEDNEPKVYGNMSAREYRLQRRHAESFKILDFEELEKRRKTMVYNPSEQDLLEALGNDDGEIK